MAVHSANKGMTEGAREEELAEERLLLGVCGTEAATVFEEHSVLLSLPSRHCSVQFIRQRGESVLGGGGGRHGGEAQPSERGVGGCGEEAETLF